MKFVHIPPPGSFCTYEAIRDAVRRGRSTTFIDVGCGRGEISKILCSLGMTGIGVDNSALAMRASRSELAAEIARGDFALIEADAMALDPVTLGRHDLGLSAMVMEHLEDDVGFARQLAGVVKPGGQVVVCVPGRRDLWSFEDETVGHYRRYDREDLRRVLEAGGLREVEVWSVAVPVSNILFWLGDWMVKRSSEAAKRNLSKTEQSRTVSVREVPWKTVFPSWVRLLLNRRTLYPILALQRLFYRSNLGTMMLGVGRAP